MSTIEDFKNAPIGATASSAETNARYVKNSDDRWLLFDGRGYLLVDKYYLQYEGFTLSPAAPTTAREVLELVWELAHPVKEGQTIPVGTWMIERRGDRFAVGKNDYFDATANDWDVKSRRALDPIPDPEPDWLNAHAVLASMDECSWQKVWLPSTLGNWKCTCCDAERHWSELEDVTPLYPKLYPKGQES